MTDRKALIRSTPVPTAPIVYSQRLSDLYQPAATLTLISDLVGRFLHIYGIETFQSDQYGEGVRLHYRETDANGGELSDDAVCVTFAYRLKRMATALLDGEVSKAYNPPIRCRVTEFATAKGVSYDLVDA
jgi:hypothetical protein